MLEMWELGKFTRGYILRLTSPRFPAQSSLMASVNLCNDVPNTSTQDLPVIRDGTFVQRKHANITQTMAFESSNDLPFKTRPTDFSKKATKSDHNLPAILIHLGYLPSFHTPSPSNFYPPQHPFSVLATPSSLNSHQHPSQTPFSTAKFFFWIWGCLGEGIGKDWRKEE